MAIFRLRTMAARATPNETTILLVDDDEGVLRVLERMIAVLGFRVASARNAREALSLSVEEPVSLLVCDVALPRMNGYELARRFGIQSPETRVLFISGYSREAIHDRYGYVEDAPHLAKPFSLGTLAQAIALRLEPSPALAA